VPNLQASRLGSVRINKPLHLRNLIIGCALGSSRIGILDCNQIEIVILGSEEFAVGPCPHVGHDIVSDVVGDRSGVFGYGGGDSAWVFGAEVEAGGEGFSGEEKEGKGEDFGGKHI